MRRLLLAGAVLLSVLAAAGPASAHPLGNFSVNHQTRVSVSSDRVEVHYVLDQAEIPTFQERGRPAAQILAAKRAEVAERLTARVDGRPVALTLAPGGRISFPQGQGGLKTTRVELDLSAPARGARQIAIRDDTFPGRVGWKAVLVTSGRGTDVRSSVPQGDPTRGLRVYPQSLLSSPESQRTGTFSVKPGSGRIQAPDARDTGSSGAGERSGDRFTQVFEDAAAGRSAFIVLLLIAFGWGALHAISPGHGKTMVAAYLVGTRGTSRDALALGLTVTVTHTLGVFALGLVTLALSAYLLPEDLYPWLNLASGLLVVGVGASVLRSRVRSRRSPERAGHSHDHGNSHDAGHSHDHRHGHSHSHGGKHHTHDVPDDLTPRTLIAIGVSAGLLPCPSALVVLLAAISQHQVGLGLVLIIAFSAGLAATLTGLGIAVVHAGRLTARVDPSGRVFTVLPALSAGLILCVGLALTLQALPTL